MHRRLIGWLMILSLLLTGRGFADTFFEEYLMDLTFIVQRERRYTASIYNYSGKAFSERGCGPASLTNAFCVLCSVEEQSLADTMLRNIMRLLTYNYSPSSTAIDLKYMKRLEEVDEDRYMGLAVVRSRYPNLWQISEETLTPETVLACGRQSQEMGESAFCAGDYLLRGHWIELTKLLRAMKDEGMGDAVVTICMLACGTATTEAPFRLGQGHYATLCFQVDAFCQKGAIYLLDSNPRALPWEKLQSRIYYDVYQLDIGGEPLTDTFDVTRISPCVIRLCLREEMRRQLDEIGQTEGEEAMQAAEEAYLDKLYFFGNNVMMVAWP